jgi:hypothetical protein
MRDRDIRDVLDAELRRQHPKNDTWIFHEFGVAHGASRVDIGLVNGSLEGFEIKSERDTLRRLPAQVAAYNRVFDRVAIVASGKHVDPLLAEVPQWWGVMHAIETPAGVAIEVYRQGRDNPQRDPLALAELLWRDELLAALDARDLVDGVRSKPKRVLQQTLTAALDLDDLSAIVREALKRRDWRSAS